MERQVLTSWIRSRMRRVLTRTRLADFLTGTRGNVAIITALAAIPIMTAVGCGIDYSTASMVRSKLQASADVATLASVSVGSSTIQSAKGMSGNGAISGGSTRALNVFNANLPTTTTYSGLTPTATVTKSGTTITASLTYTAQVPTLFLGI